MADAVKPVISWIKIRQQCRDAEEFSLRRPAFEHVGGGIVDVHIHQFADGIPALLQDHQVVVVGVPLAFQLRLAGAALLNQHPFGAADAGALFFQ